MSTFGGLIPEIDYISIDRFTKDNLNSYAFFLSHCHKDHMEGIWTDTTFFESTLYKNDAYLYMSPVSKCIMAKFKPQLIARIKELDMCGPNIIEIPGQNRFITVSLLPAGHCPGSVMFLFETDKTILYTGDIRLQAKEMNKFKAFYDTTNTFKQIDHLFLDTTFFGKEHEKFPSREESISEFCDIINKWLGKNPKNIVSIITPATYGSEFLFIEIYNRLKIPIHVDKDKFKLYSSFPEMDSAVTLTDKTRIHNFCIGWNIQQKICSNFDPNHLLTIKPTALIWTKSYSKHGISKQEKNEARVCYSSHCSYEELIDIIKLLKPMKITPCVVPNTEDKITELNELIEKILTEIRETDAEVTDTEVNLEFPHKTDWMLPDKKLRSDSESEYKENDDLFDIMNSPKRRKL